MNQQLTPVTKAIIIINVVVFILSSIIFPNLVYHLAAYFPASKNFESWQILTHMFAHGGWMHLLFNMFTLLSFGPVLERVLGAQKYLQFYLICGLGAFVIFNFASFIQIQHLTQLLTEQNFNAAEIYSKADFFHFNEAYYNSLSKDAKSLFNALVNPMVGASGAIFGVVTAFALLYPNAELIFMFIPFPIKAKYLLPIIIIGSLFLGIKQYEGDNVAHFAHLGGALVGFIYIYFWKKNRYRIN